jgi:hypothetical protein
MLTEKSKLWGATDLKDTVEFDDGTSSKIQSIKVSVHIQYMLLYILMCTLLVLSVAPLLLSMQYIEVSVLHLLLTLLSLILLLVTVRTRYHYYWRYHCYYSILRLLLLLYCGLLLNHVLLRNDIICTL